MGKMQMKFLVKNKKRKERLSTCNNCEHYNSFFKQCKICKCFMPLKTMLVNANCPINKWQLPSSEWSTA